LGGFFDAPAKQAELEKSEKLISEPGFWDDQEQAQKVVQQRSRIERALKKQQAFETAETDADVQFEIAAEEAESAKDLETLNDKLENYDDAAKVEI
jgi:peptide chain release factor 2